MKISWHGQSCIRIITNTDQTILFDPYITGNPTSDLNAETVEADVIIITHAHNDHIGDTEAIAKRTNALIIANVEIANYFSNKGYRTHGMQMGGKHQFDFGLIKMTPAIHGSTYESDGLQLTLGLAVGIILSIENKTFYHAGDTALFSDMQLIGAFKPIDIAFLPIGDNYTMGPEDAALAAELLAAKKVVPIHYNTFPLIHQDPEEFTKLLAKDQGIILEVGAQLTL